MDPGLSFGTGDHFTTRFCLELLDQLCQKIAPKSLLDVGTGSGLLAIAAARLGCPRVLAVDNDPQAIAHAKENVEMNSVDSQVELRVMDITDGFPPAPFDVVCANLYGQLIMEAAPTLAHCATRRLILSGMREAELDPVAEALILLGAREIVRDGDGQWGGLMLDMGKS
jgi:ribosomal protein L11 methyltransferase